jgi:hypothetical protein
MEPEKKKDAIPDQEVLDELQASFSKPPPLTAATTNADFTGFNPITPLSQKNNNRIMMKTPGI